MIVVCPCCNRRYRHDFEGDRVAAVAHCSTCDERFPLAQPKRTYVLAAADSPSPVSVGTAHAGPAVATREARADEGGMRAGDLPVAATGATDPTVEIDLPLDDGDGAATDLARVQSPLETALGADGEGVETSAEPTEASGPEAVPRTRAMLESVVALLPGGVGAALAYHYAGPLDQDPITWAALGGAIGLLLGWACLIWITRGD
jgi:hypothetical protein